MEWPIDIKDKTLWRLYDAIFNSIESLPESVIAVIPVYCDKTTRGSHYCSINKENFNNKGRIEKTVKDLLEKILREAHVFLKSVKEAEYDRRLIKHVDEFFSHQDKYKKLINQNKFHEVIDDYLRFFINIPTPRNFYEVGILSNLLEELNDNNKRNDNKSQLIEEPKLIFLQKKIEKAEQRQIYTITNDSSKLSKLGKDREIPKGNEGLFSKYVQFLPLFFDLFGFSDEEHEPFNKNGIIPYPCIVLPIFDNYIKSKGYGGIQGAYLIYLSVKDLKKQADITKHIYEIMKPIIPDISTDIYSSNIFRIEEKKIKRWSSCTFIDYFLQMIIYVQDWENIWVITQSKKAVNDNFSVECINQHWGRTSPEDKEGQFTYKWGLDDEKKERKLDSINNENHNYFEFSIQKIAYLLEDECMKEKEISKYSEYYLICEFPKASVIPKDDYTRKLYNEQLEQRFVRIFQIAIRMWMLPDKMRKLNESNLKISKA